MQSLAIRSPIFLPSVHAAPVHHHRRANRLLWNLKVADYLLALEGDLHAFQRRVHIGGRPQKNPQRSLFAVPFFPAAPNGITADAVVFECLKISFPGLLSPAPSFLLIAKELVLASQLAPFASPQIGIETAQAADQSFNLLALDSLKGINLSGAAQDLRLDLFRAAALRFHRSLPPCPSPAPTNSWQLKVKGEGN